MLLRSIILIFLLVKNSLELSFQCEFKISEDTYAGKIYACYADGNGKIWDLKSPEITYINGTHLAGKTDECVKEFVIHHSKVKYFPKNILSFFPNCESISIYPSEISKLSSADLEPYPNLKSIYIKSKIISIPGDLFKFNQNLVFVGFENNNHLQHVGENLLENLKQLKTAKFLANKCVNVLADTPEKITSLKDTLVDDCPPEIDFCPSSCSIDNIQSELDEQRNIVLLYLKTHDEKLIDHQIALKNIEEKIEIQQKIDSDFKKIFEEQQIFTEGQRLIINKQQDNIENLQQKVQKTETSLTAMRREMRIYGLKIKTLELIVNKIMNESNEQ